MKRDFNQQQWDERLRQTTERLIRAAIWEDNESTGDLTSRALIPVEAVGRAAVVAREEGVVAGLAAAPTVLALVDSRLVWRAAVRDGDAVRPGTKLGEISGPVREMLVAERLLLNLVGRLSGVATLAGRYVQETVGTGAKIYDTRKTTLGWRRLEKYAVHCGGARNHRTGLFDAVLIKDNHLACAGEEGLTPGRAVARVRETLENWRAESGRAESDLLPILEVEVDSLDQLRSVLPEKPDVVLLDNMKPETLVEAVALRKKIAPEVELEASGGINFSTVRSVAETGVDRISVGALTHSARSLDIGLDWES